MTQTYRAPQKTIPRLENGDRLTRVEFEHRYSAMPHIKKAELIEGTVYMASPLRITQHGEPHARMMTWLGVYWASTPGVQLGDNCTVRLDADNEPQPDALLRIENGGRSSVNPEGYVEGAPELIVEVAASTVSLDANDKLKVYRRNRVQEYILWRVEDGELDWFGWQEGEYVPLMPDEMGIICSEVFPGLWLDRVAFLDGNLARAIATVQRGISTTEHQEFVDRFKQT
nr:Uma2 family endonuclease [Zarconia navalis]